MRLLTTGLLVFASACIGTITAPAVSAAEGAALAPYKATYITKAMGMKVRIERELVKTDEGYRLTSNGKSMLAKINESARFRLDGEDVQGIDYQYQLKSVVRRKREVIFYLKLELSIVLKRASGQSTSGQRAFSTSLASKSSCVSILSLPPKLRMYRPTPSSLGSSMVLGSRTEP